MKTVTLEELLQNPLTEKDKEIIENARPVITYDCPEQTQEQLKQFKPWYEVRAKRAEKTKQPCCMKLEVLETEDLRPFDMANYLDTEELQNEYLKLVSEENAPEELKKAIQTVEKAKELAKNKIK